MGVLQKSGVAGSLVSREDDSVKEHPNNDFDEKRFGTVPLGEVVAIPSICFYFLFHVCTGIPYDQISISIKLKEIF